MDATYRPAGLVTGRQPGTGLLYSTCQEGDETMNSKCAGGQGGQVVTAT